MPYEHILTAVDDGIATITMNRPARRNALSAAHVAELIDAVGVCGRGGAARVVILAGNGPAFCAGHDLGEMIDRAPADYQRLFEHSAALMAALHAIPQPVIARVHGIATAAGCQLAASCDLVVASEDARFATPGVQIGLFCTTPMVPLTRAVGRKRAMEMLLTGAAIDARTAADWGLVNRVVSAARLVEETRALAEQIAASSAATIATGKRAFYDQIDLDERRAYAYAQQVMSANAQADDAQEGMRAFIEKRPPRWSS